MKSSVVFLVWIVGGFVGGIVAVGQSVVDVSLNLHYTNPPDASLGGKWFLVAKTNAPHGIAGVELYARHIHPTGVVYGNGGAPGNGYSASVSAATLGAITNNGEPFVGVFSGVVNVLYAQDLASGPIVLDIGQGIGTPANITSDPLGETAWNNAALIASGTFGALRPEFATVSGNATRSNVFANSSTIPNSNSSLMATTITHVRELEMIPGDFNFDGHVNAADYVVWRKTGGTGTQFGIWRGNFGTPAGAGAVSGAAVPEPSTLGLMVAAMVFRHIQQTSLAKRKS